MWEKDVDPAKGVYTACKSRLYRLRSSQLYTSGNATKPARFGSATIHIARSVVASPDGAGSFPLTDRIKAGTPLWPIVPVTYWPSLPPAGVQQEWMAALEIFDNEPHLSYCAYTYVVPPGSRAGGCSPPVQLAETKEETGCMKNLDKTSLAGKVVWWRLGLPALCGILLSSSSTAAASEAVFKAVFK
ncbi:Fibrinogen- domains (FReDs) [Branchiostoma belcheri]|nr:Fibrinogen- domains (FReDs) [Branchiostoma belcheri]